MRGGAGSQVKELIMSMSELKPNEARLLAQGLSKGALPALEWSVRGLYVTSAGIHRPFFVYVVGSLNLAGNRLTCNGSLHVARALRSCPQLRHLILGYNAIGPVGAIALAAALEEGACPRLEVSRHAVGKGRNR
jgi:hypothetical protein